jgi:hypothetical protein
MAIDYESLLRRYIAHVLQCEGRDFVSQADEPEFTQEELAWMEKVSAETWEKAYGDTRS